MVGTALGAPLPLELCLNVPADATLMWQPSVSASRLLQGSRCPSARGNKYPRSCFPMKMAQRQPQARAGVPVCGSQHTGRAGLFSVPLAGCPEGKTLDFNSLEPSPVPAQSRRSVDAAFPRPLPHRGLAKNSPFPRQCFQALKSAETYFLKKKIYRKLQRNNEPPTTTTQN